MKVLEGDYLVVKGLNADGVGWMRERWRKALTQPKNL